MIYNVHEREYPVPASRVGELLGRMAGPDSPLWPVRRWPAMVLDGPLDVGAGGGHGPVRYRCTAYQPGRKVEFTFVRSAIRGTHTLTVRDGRLPGTCWLRHVVLGRARGIGRLSWPVALRWLHDALAEDLMDHVADSVGHPPARRANWSAWVRLLRLLARARLSRSVRPAALVGGVRRDDGSTG